VCRRLLTAVLRERLRSNRTTRSPDPSTAPGGFAGGTALACLYRLERTNIIDDAAEFEGLNHMRPSMRAQLEPDAAFPAAPPGLPHDRDTGHPQKLDAAHVQNQLAQTWPGQLSADAGLQQRGGERVHLSYHVEDHASVVAGAGVNCEELLGTVRVGAVVEPHGNHSLRSFVNGSAGAPAAE